MKTLYIGIDDTDMLDTPGTGHLARELARQLSLGHQLHGVTRHQLLEDPRIPCTKNNSSACIILSVSDHTSPQKLFSEIREIIIAHSASGSDPGLCIASLVPEKVKQFGYKAKRLIVTQDEARNLGALQHVLLEGLGGDEDGIIGALSAVGLAADGNDGRYVLVGHSRDLHDLQPVSTVLAAGITAVQMQDGTLVTEGKVQTDRLRPARRNGQPIAVVEWAGSFWMPLKLD